MRTLLLAPPARAADRPAPPPTAPPLATPAPTRRSPTPRPPLGRTAPGPDRVTRLDLCDDQPLAPERVAALPPSPGAGSLPLADLLVRLAPLALPVNAEPRPGVPTALLGAPFLVALARKAAP